MAQSAVTTPSFGAKSDSIPVDVPARAQLDKTNQPGHGPLGPEATPNFSRVLDDAMLLLTHAAETGTNVDEITRASILSAKAAANPNWDFPGAANLLAALSALAAKFKPVTADSLRASSSSLVNPDIRSLRLWTSILTVPIVLFSVLSFVSSSISTTVRTDVTTANELLVKLRAELGAPNAPTAGTPEKPALPAGLIEGDVLTQLQQYASTVRAIDARSRQLNWFVLNAEHDPYANYRWNRKLNSEHRLPATHFVCSSGNLCLFVAQLRGRNKVSDIRTICQDELGALSHRWHRRIRCRTVQLRPDAGHVNLASGNRIPRWLRS